MGIFVVIVFAILIAYLIFTGKSSANNSANGDVLFTEDEIEILQTTWGQVVEIKEAAAGLFYGRLFEVAPEVKPLFNNDMQTQGDKLISTIAKVVNSIDKLDRVVPVLQDLAIGHIEYDVLYEHYAIVGDTLLWTLEQGLGEGFTEETKRTWTKAYTVIAKVMTDAAYDADKQPIKR
ncbi:MAG: hemin receptor [Methyloprofundus sp.]|nr:hemin receptor [Methyloprofundus sp.]